MSYWTIIACDEDGYFILDKFLYSDKLDHALEDAAKFQAGIFKMANPEATITVIEWKQENSHG